MKINLIVLISLCMLSAFSSSCKSQRPLAWFVYYGDSLAQDQIDGVDLVVVEPDHIQPKQYPKFKGLWVAYLSLGEVNRSRSYFDSLKDQGALLEENVDWPGAYRLNVNNQGWRDLLINKIIPDLVAKGYSGLFFDTIDVASYLESKDRQKYGGSIKAMVGLIQEIHQKFPNLLLFPNNGLDFIYKLAPFVDGVFVEDLYTSYDFGEKKVVKTAPDITIEKEKILDLFKNRYNKNVFVIHYGDKPHDELSSWALGQAKIKNYYSYLTTIHLDTIGFMPSK